MADIRSFPNNQDEYIGAESVMRWLHGRSSGVFGADGNAAVSHVVDSMAVTVSDGNGWISNDNADGVVWWIENEAATASKLQLSVDMADAVLPRIDRVVVSWQTTNYVALPEVIILKGTPASNPVPPALTNNNLLRQISLASIRIPAGAMAITASMITDERLDDSVCGLVTCGIGVDTSVMQAQWNASYEEFLTYLGRQQAAWETFFQNIQKDSVIPVPNVEAIGKAVVVNENGDGYEFGKVIGDVPVTTTAPEDVNVWIDPNDETNLHFATMKTATATLSASGWASKAQTVNVPGVTADNVVICSPAPASHTAYHENCVRCSKQGGGTLTFACDEVPTAALTVNVVIFT